MYFVRVLRSAAGRFIHGHFLKPRRVPESLVVCDGARIAVVGNGPVSSELAGWVDAHDVVVRFNRCGNYRASGTRTDVLVLLNTGNHVERSIRRLTHLRQATVRQAKEVWFAHPPEVLSTLTVRCPQVPADAWRERSAELIRYRLGAIPCRFMSAELFWQACHELEKRGALSHTIPSSGLFALFHIRHCWPGSRVTLVGFSHEGSPIHAWDAERTLVDEWSDWVRRV